MTLNNSNNLDVYFERDTRLRQYVMATTVITPKLIILLDILQIKFPKSKISKVAKQNRQKCLNYIDNCILNVTQLNPTILRLATHLYYLYDDIIVTSSLCDKIKAWKVIYKIAERQVSGYAPLKITVSDILYDQKNYCDLSTHSIENELIDYYDEIEAWFDTYLDDYNDHNDSGQQKRYDEIISIMTDLRFLSDILKSNG